MFVSLCATPLECHFALHTRGVDTHALKTTDLRVGQNISGRDGTTLHPARCAIPF